MVDLIMINHILKSMQHRVQANFLINSFKGLLLKIVDELGFVMVMKGINNLIGIPYKTINTINRIPELLVKCFYTFAKRSTVLSGYQLAAFKQVSS